MKLPQKAFEEWCEISELLIETLPSMVKRSEELDNVDLAERLELLEIGMYNFHLMTKSWLKLEKENL